MATELARLGLYVDSSGVVRATKELKKLEREGKQVERQSGKITRSFGGLKTAALAVGSAIAAIGVTRLIGNMADAGLALDAMNSSLRVATGSAEGAAREMEFLREVSQQLGLDLRSSGDAFASLAAAAKGTALEGQGARDIFVAVSEAMTALGRGAEETEGALRAIEQMISKGNVSAEELRGQLGERLPGAFQLAARSIGVSTQELDKMLRNGEVLAEDLLPKMAMELRETFSAEAERRASGLQAEINRFKNAVFDLQSSGNLDSMAEAIRDVTSLVKDPAFQRGFAEFVGGVIRLGGFLADRAAAVGDFFTDSIEEQAEQAAQIVEGLEKRLANTRNPIAQLRIKEELKEAREEFERLQKAIWSNGADTGGSDLSGLGGGNSGSQTTGGEPFKFGPALRVPEETITTVDLIAERYAELEVIAAGVNQQLRTPQEIYQQEIELLNELRRTRKEGSDEGLIDYETYVRGVAEAQERLVESTQDSTEEMSEFAKQAARNMQDVFADFLFDPFEEGLDGMAKGFLDVLRRMVAEAAASQIFSAIGSGLAGTSFGSFFGGMFGGARADGGPVSSGKTYLVGERGPELFTPSSSGNITPNDKMGGVSVSVSVDARGTQVSGNDEQGRQLGSLIASTVRGVIIDERRPGGLLGK